MQRTTNAKKAEEALSTKPEEKPKYDGDLSHVISTGSTLLDLAISGGRIRGGGMPGGIIVEISGPNQGGKTVLMSELAGGVQRQGGEVKFWDAEARLNQQFASMFDFEIKDCEYGVPDQVRDVFQPLMKWEPEPEGKIHGVFVDSFAALNGSLEEGADEDKRGCSRAKDFSSWLRKIGPLVTKNNWLLVGSNQIRDNQSAVPFAKQTVTPGGKAIPHHCSLRLEIVPVEPLTKTKSVGGKDIKDEFGTRSLVKIIKSTVWKPHRTADIYVVYDYGIDDVRANLKYLKDYTTNKKFWTGDSIMAKAIDAVESEGLQGELREAVVDLWEEIQEKFKHDRAPKKRI